MLNTRPPHTPQVHSFVKPNVIKHTAIKHGTLAVMLSFGLFACGGGGGGAGSGNNGGDTPTKDTTAPVLQSVTFKDAKGNTAQAPLTAGGVYKSQLCV